MEAKGLDPMVKQGGRQHQIFPHTGISSVKKKSLLGIYDSANVWTGNVENIATIIIDYYQDLFTTTNLDLSSSVLDQIPFVITASMNNHLNGPFCASEVAYSLKKMGPLKVPSPNGMSPLFF